MRSVILLISAFLLMSPGAWATAAIPDQFLGEWNEDLKQCGKDENDSYLFIQQREVAFWESAGPVKAAVVRGNQLALILELTDADGTWLETAEFELSPDQTRLTSSTGTGNEFVRYRCPDSLKRPNNSFKLNPLRGAA